MKIGLDFGTTNSIISFYNGKSDFVDTYKVGGVGENYIPSVVAISRGKIKIGKTAKTMNYKRGTIYSRFKILLGKTDKKRLEENGFVDKTPQEITTIYLKELLGKFKEENRVEKIESLVLTIPEIWVRDDYESRSKIKKIVEDLGLPLKKLVSEPVSAGAYFLYNYQKQNKKMFNGHILVFDYGGGTLDISLLQTQKETIKVLERAGHGKDKLYSGRAGVAFDEKVINTVCSKELHQLTQNYRSLVNSFEQKKIENHELVEEDCEEYFNTKEEDAPIFELDCKHNKGHKLIEIMPSNLIYAFEELKIDIENSLRDISQSFSDHGVDISSAEKFRVIMVGGFSNFYLSKKCVRDFFNANSSDKRFESYFNAEDVALAISKGASIIAEDIIKVDETYPVSMKLIVKKMEIKNNKQYLEDMSIPIFKKGDVVQTNNVNYDNKIRITKAGKITLSFDTGEKESSFRVRFKNEAKELFPNSDRKNSWEIGFSIDNNSFIYVHIKDRYDKTKVTELGDLLQEYQDSIIIEYAK